MFNSRTILIVDDSGYAALDLSEAIEQSQGLVAGPVATLSEALTVLDSTEVGGAVIDCELPDACQVVMALAKRNVPLVLQTCASLPEPLDDLADRASVLVRPVDSGTVLATLLTEIGKAEQRASNKLGSEPKQV